MSEPKLLRDTRTAVNNALDQVARLEEDQRRELAMILLRGVMALLLLPVRPVVVRVNPQATEDYLDELARAAAGPPRVVR